MIPIRGTSPARPPTSPGQPPRPALQTLAARSARRRRLAPRVVVIALLGGLALAGWRWVAGERINARIEARLAAGAGPASRPDDAAPDLAPEAAFADGIAEARAGRTLEAIAAWRRAGQAPDAALAADAWFNTANLHLRQARVLRQSGGELDRTGALAELAKDAYRRALALKPDHWPARYNLQRALQWFPDADDDSAALPPAPARERAVTTMRAFSLGLP
ncbi:MxaK protein [Derxia gummosa]|uniref:MxaK protein n=1 Tax=Derxia gummosa DSM 723 TaxID=1121388 RepID=A0A8B6XC07_9BURK|nr:MxaK protein [Derxia gummosa]